MTLTEALEALEALGNHKLWRRENTGTATESDAGEVGQAIDKVCECVPELVAALQLVIPVNVCVTNTNVHDSTVVHLEAPMGELRQIAAAIAKASAP